jgi:uncharacterized membrane protein YccC
MMPYRLRRLLARQRPHLMATIRGTAAALTALAAAVFLHLACPYWAAMTALIVIQPTRGLLLEKSFYRLVGTAIGSSAGLLFLLNTRSPMQLTVGLAFWLAGCVGVGNLLYGLRSYASMMAGCTCVVIAMSGYQNPPHIYDIAFGRIACILVGITFSTLVTALFTPRQSRAELPDRLDAVVADSFSWLALLLRQGRGSATIRMEQEILIEISDVESLLDAAAAGSLCLKQQARQARSLIASLLSLLAVGRSAAEQLARHGEEGLYHGPWRAKNNLPFLAETIAETINSLQHVLLQCGSMSGAPDQPPLTRFIHHRDWLQARRASIRAALAVAAIGLTWSLTGWSQGPLMLIATSIMISIFSTKEHPAAFVGNIFLGAATGSAVAVFCRALLLPGVTNPYLAAAIIAPFLFIGVFAMTQRRTAIGATDATLFFLFVTQPGVAVTVAPFDLALGALAMLMGVGSAWLAYRYLVPIDPAIRLRSFLGSIIGDLELLASGNASETGKLQARMQHRVIRLVTMATKHDSDHLTLVEGGVAALAIAKSIQRLRDLHDSGKLSADGAVSIRETLLSLSKLSEFPGTAAEILEEAANKLYGVLQPGFYTV